MLLARQGLLVPGLPWERRIGGALFLVDGFARGTWRHDRKAGVVRVGPLAPLDAASVPHSGGARMKTSTP